MSNECYTIQNKTTYTTEAECRESIHSLMTSEYFEPLYMRFDESKLYYPRDSMCVNWNNILL